MQFNRIIPGKHANGLLDDGTCVFISVLPDSVSAYTVKWLFLYRKIWEFAFPFYIRKVGQSWSSSETILKTICKLIEEATTLEELHSLLGNQVNESLRAYIEKHCEKALGTSITKLGALQPWKLLSNRIKSTERYTKIVQDFGVVLERVSQDPKYPTLKYPISLLPYSKKLIREALEIAERDEADEKMKNAIGCSLIFLDDFVDDLEAEKLSADWCEKIASNNDL